MSTEFYASATESVVGFTIGGTKVTASGTASATSSISFNDALHIAKNLAYNIAQSQLETTTDIIEQTITLVENEHLGITGPTGPKGETGSQGETGPVAPIVDQSTLSRYAIFFNYTDLNNFTLTAPSSNIDPHFYNIQINSTYENYYSDLNSNLSGEKVFINSFIEIPNGNNSYIIGGSFISANGIICNNIAKFNGFVRNWEPIGSGTNNIVNCIACDSKYNYYIGGEFTTVGKKPMNYFAKWNGSYWESLNANLPEYSHENEYSYVNTILVDSNDNIIIGGKFKYIGNPPVEVNSIAKYDGTTWSGFGGGLYLLNFRPLALIPGEVKSIAFDSDNNLCVGGRFNVAKINPNLPISIGVNVNNIGPLAKFDGEKWIAIGQDNYSLTSEYFYTINSIVFDNNNNLYIGGAFSIYDKIIKEVIAQNVAKWNGTTWDGLDFKNFIFSSVASGYILSLSYISYNNNYFIYAGGSFSSLGRNLARNIARWDGNTWSAIGEGFNREVRSIYRIGIDLSLILVGGDFTASGIRAQNKISYLDPLDNNYLINTDGNKLYLTYFGNTNSKTNILKYDQNLNTYVQVN